MEFIKILFELTTALLPLRNSFSKSKRRKEISEWLYQLEKNIEILIEYFEHDQYPATTCERMTIAHRNIHKIIGDVVSKEDEKEIETLIGSCLNIEKTFYEYLKLDECQKRECILELKEVAGSIMGIADTLKYQK